MASIPSTLTVVPCSALAWVLFLLTWSLAKPPISDLTLTFVVIPSFSKPCLTNFKTASILFWLCVSAQGPPLQSLLSGTPSLSESVLPSVLDLSEWNFNVIDLTCFPPKSGSLLTSFIVLIILSATCCTWSGFKSVTPWSLSMTPTVLPSEPTLTLTKPPSGLTLTCT